MQISDQLPGKAVLTSLSALGVWAFGLHVCLWTTACPEPEGPEDSVGPPGTGVRDNCEQHVGAGN